MTLLLRGTIVVLFVSSCVLPSCDSDQKQSSASVEPDGSTAPDAHPGPGGTQSPADGAGVAPGSGGRSAIDAASPVVDAAVDHASGATDPYGTGPGVSSPDTGPPVSKFCGDRIRDPVLEQCDDGPGEDDGDVCTPDCRARDAFVAVPEGSVDSGPLYTVARRLGSGPHVVAAGHAGFAVVYVVDDPASSVWLQPFDAVGHRAGEPILMSAGSLPTGEANPVVGANDDGSYVVAWTDASGGTPDIALRNVDPRSGTLGPVVLANEASGSEQDPDLLVANGELVVAWTDLFDVHARRFDASLTALGHEEHIPLSPGLEGGVTLSAHDGSWALAWRANATGLDSMHVFAGGATWTTEEELPGPSGDRPALVSTADGRLVVIFSTGATTSDAGLGSGALRAAVLDAGSPGPVSSAPVHGAGLDDTVTMRPRSAQVGGRSLLVCRSLDGSAEHVAFGELTLGGDGENAVTVSASSLSLSSVSDARTNAAIAGAGRDVLVGVWEDATPLPGRPSPDLAYTLRPVSMPATPDAT